MEMMMLPDIMEQAVKAMMSRATRAADRELRRR
jgi:hypothetical protein